MRNYEFLIKIYLGENVEKIWEHCAMSSITKVINTLTLQILFIIVAVVQWNLR